MTPQEAYELDRAAKPLYPNGDPRPSWEGLSAWAKSSWEKNPAPID